MRESKAYQEIMAEGRLEGQFEGSLEVKRVDVYEAIQLRDGERAAAKFQPGIQARYDLEQLSRLFRLAIQGRPLAELRRAVPAMESQR
ncbi:MAG TPA: hypothetical protein VKU02_30720 [Gemmataceae bacterium]|nr:hypothetical protein [Gemmataceae bacterium]